MYENYYGNPWNIPVEFHKDIIELHIHFPHLITKIPHTMINLEIISLPFIYIKTKPYIKTIPDTLINLKWIHNYTYGKIYSVVNRNIKKYLYPKINLNILREYF